MQLTAELKSKRPIGQCNGKNCSFKENLESMKEENVSLVERLEKSKQIEEDLSNKFTDLQNRFYHVNQENTRRE